MPVLSYWNAALQTRPNRPSSGGTTRSSRLPPPQKQTVMEADQLHRDASSLGTKLGPLVPRLLSLLLRRAPAKWDVPVPQHAIGRVRVTGTNGPKMAPQPALMCGRRMGGRSVIFKFRACNLRVLCSHHFIPPFGSNRGPNRVRPGTVGRSAVCPVRPLPKDCLSARCSTLTDDPPA